MTSAKTVGWREAQREEAKNLRKLLIDRDVKQVDVAEAMELYPERVSEYLNGRRQWPDDFPERFRAVVEGK